MNSSQSADNTFTGLNGKNIAITGATGGIGSALCRQLACSGARLILLNRSPEKSRTLEQELLSVCPQLGIEHIPLDLEDSESVKSACEQLKTTGVDILIHNAGAYCIPRRKCDTGLDNVFQINFASPYYITRELLPVMRERENSRVIVVGSIAHNYSKSDMNDIDFSTRQRASRVYGNAKRYLMFSMYELFSGVTQPSLCIAHPGITFTNITAHYPPAIFALIKRPMKIIFMKPAKACLGIIRSLTDSCGYHEWIGPHFFNIWGKPVKRPLNTCTADEGRRIFSVAERIYSDMKHGLSVL